MIKFKTFRIAFFVSLMVLIALAGGFWIWSFGANDKLLNVYNNRQSVMISDRHGEILLIKPNSADYYARYADKVPDDIAKIFIKKEDKYFYFHPGFNPISILRAAVNYFRKSGSESSSTITQQLAKIILGNEFERGWKNKIAETFYAMALEAHFSKAEILKMYCNSVYFGNRVQGIEMASRLYFNANPENLNQSEIVQLSAALSNPTNNNPFEASNLAAAQKLYSRTGVWVEKNEALENEKERSQGFAAFLKNSEYFELESLGIDCQSDCQLTIDAELTKKIRESVKRNLESLALKQVDNGAAVVIKTGPMANELLAVVGSPDPLVDAYGYKINMATRPRAIGSTVKPLIYLQGFTKGLRPYSLVDDKEYKYAVGSGFAFYPRNYDLTYHGRVNLHYALSNSLNVPTVKVLEFVGLDNFYEYLQKDLGFKPLRPLSDYELGIALGGLDMDLVTLTDYFSIFPNSGRLKSLHACQSGTCGLTGMVDFSRAATVGDPRYVALVNKIISDRLTGADQFGAKSDLNLPYKNYAVKTGTSRDFHDSWTVGFTPDFVVGAWAGNSTDEPMDQVSGQTGAGRIWHEAMQMMYNSDYSRQSNFDFSTIKEYQDGNNIVYGLPGDNFSAAENLLLEDNLIISPHDGDTYLMAKNLDIILQSRTKAEWRVNGEVAGLGEKIIFRPKNKGAFAIEAVAGDKKESIKVTVSEEE